MKKGKDIIQKVTDSSQLETFLDPNLNKVIIMNVYEKFWGPVEIIDPWVRRLLDEENNGTKMAFLAVDKDLNTEIWGKYAFTSKPVYFLFHKGQLIETVESVDIPKLSEKIEKCLTLL